jgi:AraC-like DNA-binding protein
LTTPELRYVVVTHIHELIAVVLSDASTKANMFRVPEARLRAIKAYILENLRNPELSETAVALRQGVTSRYIRKLFELENTTFSKFVLSHRLMHAHRMLSDSLLTAMNISAIALEVGFSDLSYFDRTFRRQFHATPSEVRQSRDEQSSPHHRVYSQRARPFSAPERGREADSMRCLISARNLVSGRRTSTSWSSISFPSSRVKPDQSLPMIVATISSTRHAPMYGFWACAEDCGLEDARIFRPSNSTIAEWAAAPLRALTVYAGGEIRRRMTTLGTNHNRPI